MHGSTNQLYIGPNKKRLLKQEKIIKGVLNILSLWAKIQGKLR